MFEIVGVGVFSGVEKCRVLYAIFVPRYDGHVEVADNCFVVDADQVVAALTSS